MKPWRERIIAAHRGEVEEQAQAEQVQEQAQAERRHHVEEWAVLRANLRFCRQKRDARGDFINIFWEKYFGKLLGTVGIVKKQQHEPEGYICIVGIFVIKRSVQPTSIFLLHYKKV